MRESRAGFAYGFALGVAIGTVSTWVIAWWWIVHISVGV
jgi:preprotein translocase subunit SecF